MKLLIFTDLDGTLLNSDDYRYDAALPILAELQARDIPVMPVTSKTRQEVETLRQAIGLHDPFIVENGSGIFLPQRDRWASYHLECLGCTYAAARQGLKSISQVLKQKLSGFGDLTHSEIEQLTGLSPEDVKQAKAREFSEPFVTPANIAADTLTSVAESLGFQVVVGDRFSHLIGQHAGKGRAVRWLVQYFRGINPDETLMTVGLGNSPNDLPLLEAVDKAIVIPGKNGPHPGLNGRGWQVASSSGSQGWATAIAAICQPFFA